MRTTWTLRVRFNLRNLRFRGFDGSGALKVWGLGSGPAQGSERVPSTTSQPKPYLEAHTLHPFLGPLLFKITDPSHKTRYPKKGVGYEPRGKP